MLNLDFSNVKNREPLPEGTYLLTIKKVTSKLSSTGNPMLVIQFEEPETKTNIFENYSLQEQAIFKLQGLLKAIGLDADAQLTLDESELEGSMIRAALIQDEYNGNINNKIKAVYSC